MTRDAMKYDVSHIASQNLCCCDFNLLFDILYGIAVRIDVQSLSVLANFECASGNRLRTHAI
jgi:hypothetical protein